MTPSTHLEDFLLRYLLDQLEPHEREEADIRLISDAEFAGDFQQAQDDLLDAYAAGRLSREKLAKVEQAIAANTAFARAAQMAAAFRQARLNPSPRRTAPFHVPRWAMAACAILVIGGIAGAVVWRSAHRAHSNPQTAVSTVAVNPPSVTSAPSPSSAAPSIAAPSKRTSPTRLLAVLVLPEGTRGTEPTPLDLNSEVRRIEVQWPVSPDAEMSRQLVLEVLQGSDRIARAGEEQPRQTIGGTPVARFVFPAGNLPPGTYLFRIALSADVQPGSPPFTESQVRVARK